VGGGGVVRGVCDGCGCGGVGVAGGGVAVWCGGWRGGGV